MFFLCYLLLLFFPCWMIILLTKSSIFFHIGKNLNFNKNGITFFSMLKSFQLVSSQFWYSLNLSLGKHHNWWPNQQPFSPSDQDGNTSVWQVAKELETLWLLLLLLLSGFSHVRLFATPWTAAYQAPLSMGFSRQEYWSGVPLPSPTLWLCYAMLSHFSRVWLCVTP